MFYFSIILRDTSEKGNKCGITNTFGKRNLKYFFFDEILLLDDDTDKDPNPTKNETFCSEFVTLHCTQSISLIVTYYTVFCGRKDKIDEKERRESLTSSRISNLAL